MINVLAAVGLWAAVLINAILWRNTANHATFWALLLIAICFTMKLDPVYLRLDPLIGGRNYLTLTSNLVLLAGIFVLTSGIARAVAEETTTPTWIIICMVLSGVILTVLFLLLTPQPTTTTFNISSRDQPLTLVHTSFLALVMALAFSGTAIVCLREFSSPHRLRVPHRRRVHGCRMRLGRHLDRIDLLPQLRDVLQRIQCREIRKHRL